MIQGAATTRQQRRRAEKYAQLSFDPSRLEQIMLLTEENNKLKSKLEETQEHFSKATGLPLEGYQLRQQCINLEKQFQASQNQLMESESMRIADRNYISELVQNIQSLQSELEIAKTSDWKRVDVIADEKDTLFNDILIKLRHYKCEIFGLQAAFNEFSGWKGKIKTIHGKTDGLTSSISHLEAKLRDLVKEGDDMSVSKQNDTMVYVPLSELSDIKERNLGLEFEIKDLTTKNDENERLIQELRKKLENSHREEECKSFKSTIEELQTSEAALLKEVYELKETRSMCNEKINRLSQNIEKAEREKMSAEKISEELKQINQQLQIVSSLRDKDSQSSELQLKLDQLKVKLENKQEQYKKLHKDVRSFVETVSDNAGILLNKKEPVSNQLSTALENIKVYINNTSEGLVSRRNLHKKLTAKAAALRKAEQELESSNKVIDELRIQLEEMKQRHNTELMELELASQEEITKYINEISQLKDAIKTAEYELEYLKSPDFEPDKELPKKVEELTQELLISKEKQKQLQRINDKQQNECEELRKQISQLSADDGKSGSEGKFEEIFLKAKPLKPKRVKAPLKENGGDNEVLSPGKKAPKYHAGIQETSKNEEIFTDPWSSDSDDDVQKSFCNEIYPKEDSCSKIPKKLGPEVVKMDTSPRKTEKEKEFISSEKTSPGEFLDSWLKEFSWSDDIIDDRLLPGSDGGYRNETSPKEAKSTKSTNELGAEAKKMDTSPRKTEKDIELSLPGRWSPKNQATTSETSKISEQSPPSRFNPKQRQTVLPPVRSRHTGLPQNVLPVPTDEFENSFGNENSSRAQKYTKSTNELGAEAKKKDTSPMKTEKEKEFISSVKKSPKGRAMAEVLDSLLEEFGCSDDIIEDRLLPGSDGGYRNETSPKEAKSTKSTNELGAEAKKMDTSLRKTEKDIELFLPGRWSPKNQAKTSENSKISEQSPPSRFNPKQRQTVLPPVRSRHTGLPQNVLPVPTDEFENSFGNENSSRAHTYIKSTNELGAEAKKMDNSPMKTEKEKEVISSENMSDDEFLDLWLKEFGWSDDIIDDRLLPGSDGGYRNETSPKEAKSTKSTNELGAEAKKMDTSPRKTEKHIELSLPGRWSPKNQVETSENSKISEQSPPSRFNPKQRQTVLPPVRSRHTGLPQNVLPVPTDEFENSFGNVKSSRAQKYTKSTNELGAEAKKMDTSPMKTEKEKEFISSVKKSPKGRAMAEVLDSLLEEFGCSDDIIEDRLLPGSDGGYRNETSPKEAKSTKSTNELGAEAKKTDTSPRKTEKDIELSLPGRWSPKNQATTSENSKISEQSPPSRFNPKQRQTVLPPVRSRHTGLSQNVLPVPTDEFENSFGNENSSRAHTYIKSTNELGAEAKKMDNSPMKTEKEKEVISSENMSPGEFLDLWLKEFGWSDDIIDDRLLPGSNGGYRNETSPKEAKSTKSTNELGAEAKKMDTSPRKTEKDIELSLPGRWSPKNQATTSETSKISEQSPPSRFNPKQRQTVLPPVRSRHTGLPQNVLPVPTDEFENSFGNVKSSRAQKYTKSTNELGAEAKKKDTSPRKTEKEKELISSENMSHDEFLDSLLEEFGWSDDIIEDRLLTGSDGGYRNETSPKEAKSTKSRNELGAEAKKMDTSPKKIGKEKELISSLKKVEAGSEDVEKKKKVTFLLERHSR
nr:restin homolog [Nothobranchius furzeri]